MLRSYDQIRFDVPASRLLAAGEGCFMIDGGGKRYRTPWHWHDCVMILLPICGSVEFSDESRHAGTWLAQDRFVVVPKSQSTKRWPRRDIGTLRSIFRIPWLREHRRRWARSCD